MKTAYKILLAVAVAALAALGIWTYLWMNCGCTSCIPFTGILRDQGENLTLTIYHQRGCLPSACCGIGAYADSLDMLNISITEDGRQPVFLNRSIRVNEVVVIPRPQINTTKTRLQATVHYRGYGEKPHTLVVVDQLY